MIDEEQIPIPDDSGSTGDQGPAIGGEVLPPEPRRQMPVVQAFNQGLKAHPKLPLGDVGSDLATGIANQLAMDIHELKQENSVLRKRNDELRDCLEDERIRNAELVQRLRSIRTGRILRNVGTTVGTIITGAGISTPVLSATTPLVGIPLVLIVCGTALLIASWFTPEGNKTKAPRKEVNDS